jgi:hypothetical protein
MIDGIAAENLYSLALHDFCDGGAELHGHSFPKTGRCWCRPVADSWNRILSIGKARGAPRPRSADMRSVSEPDPRRMPRPLNVSANQRVARMRNVSCRPRESGDP